ncbi:MAG: T9SS type A sorting domain-containing protein [Bacteroidales bacterium]|nr:T9SS type A sorting domain-containing protein [Bacteroidales bacterium]
MSRLKHLLLLLSLTTCIEAYPQDWPKIIQEPGPGAYASWMIEAYDHGYFIIGPKATYKYSWIIKTDINGDILWNKKVGDGQYRSILGSIDQSFDGGFVVTGQSNKYDSYGDPVIMKFSPCGEVEWCTVINTPGDGDRGRQIRSTPDGGYLMLAMYSDPNPLNRIQLFKFDQSGELIWRQNYPPDSTVFGEDSKNLYVDSSYYIVSAVCYYLEPGSTGGYERPYYIKTDTAGNVIWRLVYGSGNGFHGFPYFEPRKSTSGFFYDVGYHSNYCDTPALWKYSEAGEELYYQELYPEACPGGGGALNFIDDTTLVAFVGGTVNGQDSSKWIKVDTFGIQQSARYYPTTWITGTSFSVISPNRKIVSLSGKSQKIYFYRLNDSLEFDSLYTIPRTYDSLCPYPIVSDTVDPDCGLIVSIQDPQAEPEAYRLKIYPNPASGKLTIEVPEFLEKRTGPADFQVSTIYHQWGSATLEAWDLFGKKLLEKAIEQGSTPVELDVSHWPAGMVVFRLIYQGGTVATEKVVIR